ncbi:MAG: hypothetical protein R3Y05_00350 [bacterium]
MKKLFKISLSLFLLTGLISLTGCDFGCKMYDLTQVLDENNAEVEIDTLCESMFIDFCGSGAFTLVIKQLDGTEDITTGDYVEKDGYYVVTADGETISYKIIDDKTISLEDGYTFIFKLR